MALEDFKSLRRRYASAKAKRGPLERDWDEIEKFTGPLSDGGSATQGSSGSEAPQTRAGVWDLTAIHGRDTLTAQMHGSVIPSSVKWFHGTFRKNALNKNPKATKFRDEVIEEAWNTIGSSDFYTEMARTIHDLAGPGNGFISMEPIVNGIDKKTLRENFEGIDFNAIPLGDAFFEPDRKGMIRVFWQRFMWTPSEILDFCVAKQDAAQDAKERDAWEPPEDVKLKVERGENDPEEFVFCVFPRPAIMARKKLVYPAAPKNRPWGAMWWRESKGERIGPEAGYYEQPIYYCPWAKTSGSRWGHGPAHVALPTIRYVNQWKENYKTAGEKALDPSFVTTERNVVTDVDLRPGCGTVVRDVEAIRPFVAPQNFTVAEKIIQDDVATIRTIFRMDDLQLKESPAMTATEVQVRYELMNRILGKTLTNIQTFLLGPMIKSIISMLTRLGRIPEMPDEVEAAGGTMNIEYQGPLARSQRTDEVAAVERYLAIVYGMAQFEPRMRAAVDAKKIANYVRDRLGIPADLAPTDQEMEARMKEIDKMQAEAMQAATAKDKAAANKANADAAAAGPVQGAQYPQLPVRPYLAPSGQVVTG